MAADRKTIAVAFVNANKGRAMTSQEICDELKEMCRMEVDDVSDVMLGMGNVPVWDKKRGSLLWIL